MTTALAPPHLRIEPATDCDILTSPKAGWDLFVWRSILGASSSKCQDKRNLRKATGLPAIGEGAKQPAQTCVRVPILQEDLCFCCEAACTAHPFLLSLKIFGKTTLSFSICQHLKFS